MLDLEKYKRNIFNIPQENRGDLFTELALQAFDYQRNNCPVYNEYLKSIGKSDFSPTSIEQIPFLPITLFKSEKIITSPFSCKGDNNFFESPKTKVFTSSATTSMTPSRHFVTDITLYEESFLKGFELTYGNIEKYNILALLPSYLEREGSSLVYMVNSLIERVIKSGGIGGFFLYNHRELLDKIVESANLSDQENKRKTILFGVSFALIEFGKFIEKEFLNQNKDCDISHIMSNLIIIETGGMKGREEEMSRESLHAKLAQTIGCSNIHSEYGMAELLSQAYCTDGENFLTPPWMRFILRSLDNPFELSNISFGGINIIDLANINSCCFIQTEDLGQLSIASALNTQGQSIKILGRISNSERRGCNMLIENY